MASLTPRWVKNGAYLTAVWHYWINNLHITDCSSKYYLSGNPFDGILIFEKSTNLIDFMFVRRSFLRLVEVKMGRWLLWLCQLLLGPILQNFFCCNWLNSVSRFCEIWTIWQFSKSWYISIDKTIDLIWQKLFWHWANYHCCKWTKLN